MDFNFSADEIFEMAKQLERNGAAFYKKAAETVEGDVEKKFLLHLALMEEAHEQIFNAMQNELGKSETQTQLFDPEGEAALYLQALADTRVFFKKAKPGNDVVEILKSAIEAEKDSIIFYVGMKDLVSETHGKKRIDGIIKEEMGHIRILSSKLMEYT